MLGSFAAVAVAKVLVDFAIFNAAMVGRDASSIAQVLAANAAAFLVAGWVSYVLHARFTFRVARGDASFARYVLVSLGGAALYTGALALLIGVAQPSDLLALNTMKIAALAASAPFNFVGYRRLVFAPRQS